MASHNFQSASGDAMLGQLPLDFANEVVGVFKKHFKIDRLGRT